MIDISLLWCNHLNVHFFTIASLIDAWLILIHSKSEKKKNYYKSLCSEYRKNAYIDVAVFCWEKLFMLVWMEISKDFCNKQTTQRLFSMSQHAFISFSKEFIRILIYFLRKFLVWGISNCKKKWLFSIYVFNITIHLCICK